MLACSCELLTKVVERAVPFHFTAEVETKPVPFTVRSNGGPPGAVASGTNGWLTKGSGFWASAAELNTPQRTKTAAPRAAWQSSFDLLDFMAGPPVAWMRQGLYLHFWTGHRHHHICRQPINFVLAGQ